MLRQPLQHGLDAGIDGDVRDAGAADDVGLSLDVGEMQEAAEVVILVENVEERLDFRGTELKGGERHGLAELARDGEVAIHNFAKAQHGRTEQVIMRIPQGLKPLDGQLLYVGAKAPTPKPEHSGLKAGATTRSTRECSASGEPREARVWRAAPGFGKMLGGNSNDGKDTL